MPRKKAPLDSDPGAWRVILEDVRAQISVFGDALNAGLREMGQKLDVFREETHTRLEAVETAVRQNSADIRQNSADIRQNSADIRSLTSRVEKLEGIEERVTALERQTP